MSSKGVLVGKVLSYKLIDLCMINSLTKPTNPKLVKLAYIYMG